MVALDCSTPQSSGIIWAISFRLGEREGMAKKEKAISYRRAEWLSGEPSNHLAGYIKFAATRLLDVSQRTIPRDNGQVMSLTCLQADSHGGYCLHITAETPGEAASVVPKRRSGTDEIQVATTAPPADAEFMDGDAFVYVRHNDVCLCGTGMQDSTVLYFLHGFFKAAKLPEVSQQFDLLKVANVDAVKFLQQHGVKEVELRAALYAATTNYHKRKGHTYSLLGGLARLIRPLFTTEHDVTEDALKVTLTVKTDERGKGLKLGEKRITAMAADLVRNQEKGDDFTIVTKTGQRIGPEEILMRATVAIDGKGKSVDRDKAWKELKAFYDTLEAAGALEE